MWYQTILIISLLFFTGCSKKMFVTEYYDLKLIINTKTDTVSDLVDLAVSFENNTTNDIYLLNREHITVSDNLAYVWRLEILFQNTILMISPINFFSKTKIPTKEDYFLLKSGDKYTFNFSVDFKSLVRENLAIFGKLNTDYGEYTIKLTYKDPFLINKKGFRGIIESNYIKVLYRKQ